MDESTERALWAFTAPEIAAVAVLFVLLAASVFGDGSFLSSVSRGVRLAALVFLAVELLIPLWVYLDMRRNPVGLDTVWLHAAATPLLNVFGLVAYLDARRRAAENAGASAQRER